MEEKKPNVQKDTQKQPVMCPWMVSQQSLHCSTPAGPTMLTRTTGQNNVATSSSSCLDNHWPRPNNLNMSIPMDPNKNTTTPQYASMHQSSSQFFYFLRLMQLFPNTHPATLHTVLSLCKNDFFCAVDKLLYAKRCKMLYARRQTMQQRMAQARPYKANNRKATQTASQSNDEQTEKQQQDSKQSLENIIIKKVIAEDNIVVNSEVLQKGQTSSENLIVMDGIVGSSENIKFITINAATPDLPERQNCAVINSTSETFAADEK